MYQRTEPPAWLNTNDEDDVEVDLGLIKTGKEADAHLLERGSADRTHFLVAKNYRDAMHQTSRIDTVNSIERRTGESRGDGAIARGSRFGRVAGGRFAAPEPARFVWL